MWKQALEGFSEVVKQRRARLLSFLEFWMYDERLSEKDFLFRGRQEANCELWG